MVKHSIHQKVFRTILGVSLAFGIILCMVALGQFWGQKQSIGQANARYASQLTAEAEDRLETLNENVAFSLTSVYGTIINENFISVRTTAQSIANYMGSLYGAGDENLLFPGDAKVPGQQAEAADGYDQLAGYMAGASPQELAGELAAVGGIRRYIRTLESYRPDNLDELDIYVVTDSGMCLDGTGKKYQGEYTELRTADWYIGARESRGPYWARVFTGAATGIRKITCGVPFYDGSGRFRGVAAVDLAIDSIYDTALAVRSDQVEHALLMDHNDTVMINPDGYDLGNVKIKEGVQVTDQGFISFTSIPETNWKLCLIFRFDLVQKTTHQIHTIIESNSQAVGDLMKSSITHSIFIFLMVIGVGCAAVFFLSRNITTELVAPINRLTGEVAVIGAGDLEHRIESMDTGDEIEVLAEAFNDMTVKLKEYIKNLETVTADRERIATELNVATRIQASMLPSIFPPFPDRPEFDIYATMEPAKEVGGDFYDFFLVDDTHLGVVIADVSGKGVPAALFMVIAKTLIKNHAQAGEEPGEIFTGVNRQLCENNDAGLFVTAWMGILSLKDGVFTYVNAGHNPPMLRRGDGPFTCLKSRPGFVLAGMEGMKYRQASIVLAPGDMLYLYTDGVTEATDPNDNMFGTDRLMEGLNSRADEELERILSGVRADIEQFTDGAPQFDDITMLALRIGGYAL